MNDYQSCTPRMSSASKVNNFDTLRAMSWESLENESVYSKNITMAAWWGADEVPKGGNMNVLFPRWCLGDVFPQTDAADPVLENMMSEEEKAMEINKPVREDIALKAWRVSCDYTDTLDSSPSLFSFLASGFSPLVQSIALDCLGPGPSKVRMSEHIYRSKNILEGFVKTPRYTVPWQSLLVRPDEEGAESLKSKLNEELGKSTKLLGKAFEGILRCPLFLEKFKVSAESQHALWMNCPNYKITNQSVLKVPIPDAAWTSKMILRWRQALVLSVMQWGRMTVDESCDWYRMTTE